MRSKLATASLQHLRSPAVPKEVLEEGPLDFVGRFWAARLPQVGLHRFLSKSLASVIIKFKPNVQAHAYELADD